MDKIPQEFNALEYAKKYIELGWSIIPISSKGDKKPVYKWKKYQTNKASLEDVERWINKGYYLAVVTGDISGVMIVDDDRIKKGLPEWGFHSPLEAVSQSGGKHYYFKYNRRIQSHSNPELHIDIKGDRSYALLPPFNNRRWLSDPTENINKLESLPLDIENLIRGDKKSPTDYTPLVIKDFIDIPEGERSGKLYQWACHQFYSTNYDEGKRILFGMNQTFTPPLDETEFNYNVSRAWEFVQNSKLESTNQEPSDKTKKKKKKLHLTDTGNAEKIAELFGNKLRFDHRRNRWLVWDQHRWKPDNNGSISRYAIDAARKRFVEASTIENPKKKEAVAKWAMQSESRQKIEAAIALARDQHPITDDGKNWDSNEMLLSCKNGIIDLTTGKLRDGQPEDRITMQASVTYDSGAPCPRWEQFLDEIFQGDKELIRYVQKALGYSITGSVKSQAAFFCYGNGANGKSVMFKTISNILGDYSYDAPASLFRKNLQASNSNDEAATEFKRFLVSSETLTTARINEQRLKAWTGGDNVTARYLYQENFTFKPTAKPWMFINHLPGVDDNSFGFWRRIKLISFNRIFKPEEQDENLVSKLETESSGILNWLIEGCLLWQKEGLSPTPEVVEIATKTYQSENDVLSDFIVSECEETEGVLTQSTVLYKNYVSWAEDAKLKDRDMLSNTLFGKMMTEKHNKVKRNGGLIHYQGIKLKNNEGLLEELGRVGGFDPISIKLSSTSLSSESFIKTTTNPPSGTEIITNPPLVLDKTVDDMSDSELSAIFQ
ncbi:MAG: phage/plasmid primase, P4 family [Candidatus Shapirobacteria bacterium]|jgi:putative DNA primase/helicase